jgi:hypothetical protein
VALGDFQRLKLVDEGITHIGKKMVVTNPGMSKLSFPFSSNLAPKLLVKLLYSAKYHNSRLRYDGSRFRDELLFFRVNQRALRRKCRTFFRRRRKACNPARPTLASMSTWVRIEVVP